MDKKGKISEMLSLASQGKCPFCGHKDEMEEFRDRLSLEEFKISGLCQSCQDEVFGKPEIAIRRFNEGEADG